MMVAMHARSKACQQVVCAHDLQVMEQLRGSVNEMASIVDKLEGELARAYKRERSMLVQINELNLDLMARDAHHRRLTAQEASKRKVEVKAKLREKKRHIDVLIKHNGDLERELAEYRREQCDCKRAQGRKRKRDGDGGRDAKRPRKPNVNL